MKKAFAILVVAFLAITLAGCSSFNLFEEPATGPAASLSTPAASSTPASDPNSEPTSTPTSTPPPEPEIPEPITWVQESAAYGDGNHSDGQIFLTRWQQYMIATDSNGDPIGSSNKFPESTKEAKEAYLVEFGSSMSGLIAAVDLNQEFSGVSTDKAFNDLIQKLPENQGYEANSAGRALYNEYGTAVMSDRCEVSLVWVDKELASKLYNSYNKSGVAYFYGLSYSKNMSAWKLTWVDEEGNPFLDEDGEIIHTYQLLRCGNPLSSEPPPDRITPPLTTPPPPPPPPPPTPDPNTNKVPGQNPEIPDGENPNHDPGPGTPRPTQPEDPSPSYTSPDPPADTTPPASSQPPAATPAPTPPPAMPAEPAPTQPGAGENNGSLALPPP